MATSGTMASRIGLWDGLARTDRPALAPAALLVAGLVVALAIVLDGAASRAVNSVGGLIWVAATVALLLGLRRERRWGVVATLALAVTAGVTLLVDPDDAATAFVAFAVAGAAVAMAANSLGARSSPRWAALVPALWLPVHLLTAVVPAILGGGDTVRTDPPPTAALVPFLMVAGALAGGWLIGRIRPRVGV